jgi:hypothetical protein
MTTIRKEGSKREVMNKFASLSNARTFSTRTIKASAIIMGDDGLFWVVTLAQMERLLKAGYELA